MSVISLTQHLFIHRAAWLVLFINLIVPTTWALDLDQVDTGEYGYYFNGVQDHVDGYTTTFTNQSFDIRLTVDGYDIDTADEVDVLVNDTFVGRLTVSPNNAIKSSALLIPTSVMVAGENTLAFVQKSPGFIWGVTNLLIERDAPELVLDVTDTSEYGYYFNGIRRHKDRFDTVFDTQPVALALTVDGYDVDFRDEVDVQVNGVSVGPLLTSANNSIQQSTFVIPVSMMTTNENTLSFIQRTPGYIWGVTNLLLTQADRLTLDEVDEGQYGYYFNNVRDHKREKTFVFDSQSFDLRLTTDGFDIDVANEVDVTINGDSIGSLTVSPNNSLRESVLLIPQTVMIDGQNTLSFVQQTPGFAWGVTNIGITRDNLGLTLNVTDTGEYGYYFSGVRAHREQFTTTFDKQDFALTLTVSGYDIDFGDEVEVKVNGVSIGYLQTGPNNTLRSSTLSIPVSLMTEDVNTLTFVQRTPGFVWGLTNLLITQDQSQSDLPLQLTLDERVTDEYGVEFGFPREDELVMQFTQEVGDLELELTGYDVNSHTELSVWLNDKILGYLPVGEADALTRPITYFIPEDSQALTNTLIVRSANMTDAWGITDILLSERATGPPRVGETTHLILPQDDLRLFVETQSSPGDVLHLQAGVHRLSGTIYPKPGQRFYCEVGAVISGAVALTQPWTLAGDTYTYSGAPLALEGAGGITPGFEINRVRNDLFIDDVAYLRVDDIGAVEDFDPPISMGGRVIYAGTFFQEDDVLHIASDPGDALVEMGDVRHAFQQWDLLGDDVTIENCTIEKFATNDLEGAVDAKYTRRWLLKNVIGRYNHTSAVRTGRSTTIVGGEYVLNGQPGITGQLSPVLDANGDIVPGSQNGSVQNGYSDNVLIDGIELAYNTWLPFDVYWHSGGAKLFGTQGFIVRNSNVHHNYGPGLWSDFDVYNSHFEDNVIQYNTSNGVKIEASFFGAVKGNTIHCNSTLPEHNLNYSWFWGAQVFLQNSQGILIDNNNLVSDVGQGIGVVDNQPRGSNIDYGPRRTINTTTTNNIVTFSSRTRTNAEEGLTGIESDSNAFDEGFNAPAAVANNVMDFNTYRFSDASWAHFKFYNHFYTADEVDPATAIVYPPEYAGVAWDRNYEQNGVFDIRPAAELAPTTLCP